MTLIFFKNHKITSWHVVVVIFPPSGQKLLNDALHIIIIIIQCVL